MLIEYTVDLYSCQVCNATKSVEEGKDKPIEVTRDFCMVCKNPLGTFKKLGTFVMKKILE